MVKSSLRAQSWEMTQYSDSDVVDTNRAGKKEGMEKDPQQNQEMAGKARATEMQAKGSRYRKIPRD